jgi:hypothetical protein
MAASEHAQAHNQILFREINERIAAVTHAEIAASTVSFLCECSDSRCTAAVQLTVVEYQELRTSPRRFLVAPDHEPGGRVVRRSPRFAVVERLPGAVDDVDRLEKASVRPAAA